MAILAGIDEAGYGPLLGPLVVSGVAFSIPRSLLKEDLWHLLNKAVSKEKKNLSGRLLINDSKKAYSRQSGIGHLLRTVLASLEILTKSGNPLSPSALPHQVEQFIQIVASQSADSLCEYPWYQELKKTAITVSQDYSIAAAVFEKTLFKNHMKLLWLGSRFMDAGHFNRRIETVKNKSRVLFIELCAVIEHIFENYYDNDGPAQFLIDRQGGRTQYHQELMKMFPGMELKILSETDTLSSYELTGNNRCMRLHFTVEADSKFFAVALASMVGKLVRELLMEQLNIYFSRLCPDIQPTAGYWQDGQRFVQDLRRHNLPFDPHLLIRNK